MAGDLIGMAKQKSNQRLVLKINSNRLRRNKWNLDLSFEDARKNKEIISLSSSQVLRFIDSINKTSGREEEINELKLKKEKLLRCDLTEDDKKEIKKINKKINKLKLVTDYVCIVFDKKADFNRCNSKKGFYINNIRYKRLLGTTGGIKNETVVYVNSKIHKELKKRLNNGRDMKKEIVPAKLEAYMALACSNSIPVDSPEGILVVDDCITHFREDVIQIVDSEGKRPILTHEKDYEVTNSYK